MRVTIVKSPVYSQYGIPYPLNSIQEVGELEGITLITCRQATDTDGVLSAPAKRPFDTVPVVETTVAQTLTDALNIDQLPGLVFYDSGADARAEQDALEAYENIAYSPIYFDPSLAADTGDGTIGNPFKLVTAARMTPGCRHLIKAGTTITTGADAVWLLIPTTGTAQAPIILGRYGVGVNPIINGALATKIIRGDTGAKFWRVRDLEVIGGGAGSNRFGISSAPPADAEAEAQVNYGIVIQRCKVHAVTTDGANDCEGVKLYGGDLVVMDCEIYDIADDGIWYHGWRALIQGNSIYRVSQSGRAAGDNIQAGANSSFSIVRQNICDHRDVDTKQCIYFEPTVSISTGCIVEDNICYGFNGVAGAQVPITNGSTNGITRRNYVTGGAQGIIISGSGGKCYHNVVIATAGVGIVAGNSGGEFFNNTIVQTGAQTGQGTTGSVAIRHGSGTLGGNVARNNVIVGFANGTYSSAPTAGTAVGLTESNNAYYITGGTPAYYRVLGVITPTTQAVLAAAAVDLGLDANYRPLAGSILLSGRSGAVATVSIDALYDKDQRAYLEPNSFGAYIGP